MTHSLESGCFTPMTIFGLLKKIGVLLATKLEMEEEKNFLSGIKR